MLGLANVGANSGSGRAWMKVEPKACPGGLPSRSADGSGRVWILFGRLVMNRSLPEAFLCEAMLPARLPNACRDPVA